jgi:hypothetical protein
MFYIAVFRLADCPADCPPLCPLFVISADESVLLSAGPDSGHFNGQPGEQARGYQIT